MIAGTADSQLDTERDELAREYGGKPSGEKKITLAGGSPGGIHDPRHSQE